MSKPFDHHRAIESMTILEIQHLTKSFGKLKAIDDLSMTISAGEAVAFIGQNGAGKSTTMRSIAGLSQPDRGSIHIAQKNIALEPVEARKHFGYVPQDLNLYKYMTGREFLSLIAKIRGLSDQETSEQSSALFELCDLTAAKNRLIREYSGGMARKIAMAGALMGNPDLVILDESFVGLDPESTYKIGQYLKSYTQKGKAILISSHILEMLHALCTRFFILHHGRCVADYSFEQLEEVCKDPETPNLTALYLKMTDQLDLMRQKV